MRRWCAEAKDGGLSSVYITADVAHHVKWSLPLTWKPHAHLFGILVDRVSRCCMPAMTCSATSQAGYVGKDEAEQPGKTLATARILSFACL